MDWSLSARRFLKRCRGALGQLLSPHEVVGKRMKRWVLLRVPGLQIVVHKFLQSDPPYPHDHPWWNCTLVLRGSLVELRGREEAVCYLSPGSFVARRATDCHRIIVDKPAWTLFITGPAFRDWGYYTPRGFKNWRLM